MVTGRASCGTVRQAGEQIVFRQGRSPWCHGCGNSFLCQTHRRSVRREVSSYYPHPRSGGTRQGDRDALRVIFHPRVPATLTRDPMPIAPSEQSSRGALAPTPVSARAVPQYVVPAASALRPRYPVLAVSSEAQEPDGPADSAEPTLHGLRWRQAPASET